MSSPGFIRLCDTEVCVKQGYPIELYIFGYNSNHFNAKNFNNAESLTRIKFSQKCLKITQIEEAYVSEFTEKTEWGKNVNFFVNLFKTFDRVTAFPLQHKNDFNPKRKNMVNPKMIITFYQNNDRCPHVFE